MTIDAEGARAGDERRGRADVRDRVAAERDGRADLRDGVAAERDGRADLRDGIAAERDGIADVREAIADEREVAWILWEATCHEISQVAERRDQTADERDADADRRDMAASRDVDLGSRDDDPLLDSRTLAGKDRAYAKSNRIASSVDRFQLTFFTPGAAERRAAANRRVAAVARLEADGARRKSAWTTQGC